MPKLKTNKSATKRFQATKNGYKRGKAYHNHILTKKGAKRKRRLQRMFLVNKNDKDSIALMLRDKT